VRLTVSGESDIGEAVRRFAQALGLTPTEVNYLATAATELVSNLWLHGGGLFEARDNAVGVELLTTDRTLASPMSRRPDTRAIALPAGWAAACPASND